MNKTINTHGFEIQITLGNESALENPTMQKNLVTAAEGIDNEREIEKRIIEMKEELERTKEQRRIAESVLANDYIYVNHGGVKWVGVNL